MRKIIIMMILLVLSGCTTMQHTIDKEPLEKVTVYREAVETRVIRDLITIQDDLADIPEDEIDLRYFKGVNISDFVNALSFGVPSYGFAVDFRDRQKELIVPRYKGSVKELFKMLQETYGFSYRKVGKNIIIQDDSQVVLKIPSVIAGNESMIKDMLSIFDVAGEDIHIDYSRGVVIALMTSKQYRKIKEYLQNNGIYQYEVDIAIIEDEKGSEKTIGVDLGQLSVVIQNSLYNGVAAVTALGSTLSLKSSGANVALSAIVNGWLSLDSVISAYGLIKDMRLDQRIRVGVLAGSWAKMDLSRKVPYVSQITATSGSTGPSSTGYQFAEAQDGLIIEVNPSGDDKTINIDTSINYQQVIEYVTLKAGENEIKRPVVQSRSYRAKNCIRPGEVVLIGSLRVNNIDNKSTGLVDVETYRARKTNYRDMSIFMGVSVVKYKMI